MFLNAEHRCCLSICFCECLKTWCTFELISLFFSPVQSEIETRKIVRRHFKSRLDLKRNYTIISMFRFPNKTNFLIYFMLLIASACERSSLISFLYLLRSVAILTKSVALRIKSCHFLSIGVLRKLYNCQRHGFDSKWLWKEKPNKLELPPSSYNFTFFLTWNTNNNCMIECESTRHRVLHLWEKSIDEKGTLHGCQV